MNRSTGWPVRFGFLAVAAGAAWFALGTLPVAARIWVVLMLVPVPAAAAAQTALIDDPDRLPRLPVYASTAVFLWGLALISIVIGRLSGTSIAEAGLVAVAPASLVLIASALVALAIASLFVSRRLGIPESPIVRRLIPVTPPEKLAFAGVSLTAGFCEELVFRGYLLQWLSDAWGTALAVAATTMVFGWMHAYQNGRGAARAAFLGLLLCVPPLLTGSILPSIVAHAAIDLIAGLVLARKLIPDLA